MLTLVFGQDIYMKFAYVIDNEIMVLEIQTKKLNKYSLLFLFRNYKGSKNDMVLGEIYRRTFDEIFDLIISKSVYRDDPVSLVQIVYKMMKELLEENEPEENVLNYLEHIVDGCIIIYSN